MPSLVIHEASLLHFSLRCCFKIALCACSNDRPPIAGDCVSTTAVPCTAPPAIGGTGGLSSCGLTSSLAGRLQRLRASSKIVATVDTACAKNPSCVDLSQCLNV